jgi:hypothetical protein
MPAERFAGLGTGAGTAANPIGVALGRNGRVRRSSVGLELSDWGHGDWRLLVGSGTAASELARAVSSRLFMQVDVLLAQGSTKAPPEQGNGDAAQS